MDERGYWPLVTKCDVNAFLAYVILIDVHFISFRIANLDPLEEGQAETILTITEITNNHTGTYTCTYTKDNATDLSEEIDIVVISNVTKYCPIQGNYEYLYNIVTNPLKGSFVLSM